jgi:hypothetical protein
MLYLTASPLVKLSLTSIHARVPSVASEKVLPGAETQPVVLQFCEPWTFSASSPNLRVQQRGTNMNQEYMEQLVGGQPEIEYVRRDGNNHNRKVSYSWRRGLARPFCTLRRLEAHGSPPCRIRDWWVCLVVAGCGGKVCYDPEPTMRYRQHGRNIFGSNAGWAARLPRAAMLLEGRFREWNDVKVIALQRIRSRLTPENRRILDLFSTARNRSLFPRLIGIKRSGIHRQTMLGNLGLFVAALLKRL